MNLIVLFLAILISTERFETSKAELREQWIEQPQDHFDGNNREMWLMRYFEHDEFFHETGPIFILIGGEDAITSDDVEVNFIYALVQVHGAMMYHIEHRYYGSSHPVPDTSFDNLKYLTIRQALADIALFIKTKKKELNIPNALVMVFGASYAGNLAAWMRVEYPELVQGALAISAPIHAKADFFEFYESVADSLHNYDENCTINIKEAFDAVEELVRGPAANSMKLKDDFNLCNEPNLSQPSEISFLMLNLADIFGSAVVDADIKKDGNPSIDDLCIAMIKGSGASPYYKLAEVFKAHHPENLDCINLQHKKVVNRYLQTSWESEAVGDRLWLYQSCTELGYFTTSSSPQSIFGSLFPLEYFMNLCKEVFAEDYHPNILNDSILRNNCMYNSRLGDVENIIFTNGNLDPWHKLSVLSDLNDDSPSIFISGTLHCKVFHVDDGDTHNLIAARCRISHIISEWLSYK